VTLKVGDEAPDFEAVASDGRRLRLSDFKNRRVVVLYFYPRDFTRICTAEACGFRDMSEVLGEKDVQVIGVSLDADESHRVFASRHKLPFPLISDRDRALSTRYGAMTALRSLMGLMRRVTYVIDKRGRVAGVFTAQLRAETHVDGVRELVSKLS